MTVMALVLLLAVIVLFMSSCPHAVQSQDMLLRAEAKWFCDVVNAY